MVTKKRKEFPPVYLYLVGNFPTSFLEHIALLEIFRRLLLKIFHSFQML